IYAYILGVPDASRSDAIRSHISLFCDWYPNDEEIARSRKLVELSGQLLFPSAEANAGIKKKLRYWQALAFVSLISVVSLVAWYKWQNPEPAVKACSAFPKMVSIPGGSFRMGNTFQTNESEAKSHEIDEYPAHTVNLDSFFLSETEITFDQYDCYTESNSLPYAFDAGAGRGYNPVIYVT
ncbi:MAG: formylglycine-generating enzyme family protein, partial [Bacteroidota bacterium]